MLDGTFDTGASNNLVFQVPATSDGSGVALFVNLTITTDDNGDKIQTMCFGTTELAVMCPVRVYSILPRFCCWTAVGVVSNAAHFACYPHRR